MSEADIIHRHLHDIKLEPIAVSIDEEAKIFRKSVSVRYDKKVITNIYNKIVEAEEPFRKFIMKKEKEIGISAARWGKGLFDKFKEEFLEQYDKYN